MTLDDVRINGSAGGGDTQGQMLYDASISGAPTPHIPYNARNAEMRPTSRNYLSPLFALLLVGGCAGGMAAGGGMHVWPSNTSVTYTVAQVQVQSMDVPGMGEMATTTTMNMEATITATGPRQFSFTINDASSTMDSPMGGEAPNVSGLKGLTSQVTLDERGLVTEATGLDANSAVTQLGGADDFKEQIQGFFLYLPEDGLAAGREWTRNEAHGANQEGLMMQMTTNADYHADEQTTYEDSQAWKILSTDQVSMVGSGDQMGTQLDISASGAGDNTMYVEVGTGRLLYMEGKTSLRGGVDAQGMSIPITMNILTTIRIKQ